MTTLRALALTTRREITERARSKAFIGSSVVTLLMVLALILIPTALSNRAVTYEIGLVGENNTEIVAALEELLAAEQEDPDRVSVETQTYPDVAAAEQAVTDGEVQLALVDGEQLLVAGASGLGGSELQSDLQRAAASVEIERLTADAGEAADIVELLTSDPLEVQAVGSTGDGGEDNFGRAIIAYGGLLLLYIAVLTYGAWTLTGVTEEKSSRVVEVLLSTLRPWHLLAGKVIGIGLLGLAQFVLTVGAALATIAVTGAFDLPALPTDSVAMLVLWFVLGYALYSVALGAAGALVSRMEDAQSTATPFTLLMVVGFIVSFQAFEDPDSVLSLVTSFIPFTAPFVVPIRFAFDAIPAWQVLASVAVTALTVYGLVRLAGRIYAGGLLRFGGRIGWREAFRSAEL